jgi:eukaryotic-like serine/threonine-protein kinase
VPGNREKLTVEGALAGTPSYMSPEQASAVDSPDARSDIYSLGAVAYFLLTAQAPFIGKSSVQILAAHLHQPVQPVHVLRPDCPDDVEAVVLRCLEKLPERRFANARSLASALAACRCAPLWTEAQAAAWWQRVDVVVAEPPLSSPSALNFAADS